MIARCRPTFSAVRAPKTSVPRRSRSTNTRGPSRRPPGRTVEDLVAGRRTVALRVGKAVFVVDDLEFEYGRLANQFLGTLGILNAGELNENIVLAFLDDGRFTHAELVDSIADSLQRLIHRTILNLEHFARGEI